MIYIKAKEKVSPDKLFEAFKQSGSTKKAAKQLGMSPEEFMTAWNKAGEVEIEPEKYVIGVISDTHWCSHYSDIESYEAFMKVCKDREVPTLIHCGDISEGLMPRKGAVHDRFIHDIDSMLDYCVERFKPFVDQFDRVYVVQGNHDESLGSRCEGFDLCHNLGKEFSRMVYRKELAGKVEVYQLKGGLKTLIHHGWGNCSANLTNRTRGIVTRAITGHTDFDILFAGHCHSYSYDRYLGKHAYSVGAFQKITPFLATKPLMPMIEGYIFTYTMRPDGHLGTIVQETFNYDK